MTKQCIYVAVINKPQILLRTFLIHKRVFSQSFNAKTIPLCPNAGSRINRIAETHVIGILTINPAFILLCKSKWNLHSVLLCLPGMLPSHSLNPPVFWGPTPAFFVRFPLTLSPPLLPAHLCPPVGAGVWALWRQALFKFLLICSLEFSRQTRMLRGW